VVDYITTVDDQKIKDFKKKALEYHRGETTPPGAGNRRPGKIEIVASKSLLTQNDLSLAYSPGVAEPCLEIQKDPLKSYEYTARGNLVAVISNGTAVLGLGDIGALAGKPVFEGKSVLFKKFADIDSIDIEVDQKDPAKFCDIVSALEPSFGGINLEDIKAPDCFVIEEELKKRTSIPVFHDDQHGTAIISGAAMLNACKLLNKKAEDLKVVFCGGGAASMSCAKFWFSLGVKKENCLMTDSKGVIYKGRKESMNEYKEFFATEDGAWHKTVPKTLEEAMVGADAFIGCSVANVVSKEMLKSMAKNPLVFAMANPDPEISYEEAHEARDDLIFATGRSDYPNQVNNVLCFPYIFRGALDVRASTVNEEMKKAAAEALALLAQQEVPENVVQSYGGEELKFGKKYIIPKPNDERVLLWVSSAVADAAVKSKVAQRAIPGDSKEAYMAKLEKLLGQSRAALRDLKNKLYLLRKAKKAPRTCRMIFTEGESRRILHAAEILKQERIAEPIFVGNPERIKAQIEHLNLQQIRDCEILHPRKDERYDKYAQEFWQLRQRKGLSLSSAKFLMRDPLYFGAMHLRQRNAEAWVGGLDRPYPEAIRPLFKIIGSDKCKKVAGLHMALWKGRALFFADTTVNVEPSAQDLVDIALSAAAEAELLGFEPRVAMLSFSNFGSNRHPEALRVKEATKILKEKHPELLVEGEIQADTAVSCEIQEKSFAFSALADKGANVLVFPNLSSANISYKLLQQLGGAEMIGPILLGMKKPAHVLPLHACVEDIVNMSTVAALDAERYLQQ